MLPPWFEANVGLEAAATRFRDFQSMVVPGLLQTEDYARAVLRAAPNPGSAQDIDRQVDLRMQRQGTLGQANPPDLWVVPSGSNGGQCVEVARNLPGAVAIRDSKDPGGPALVVTPRQWRAFAGAVRRGTLGPG